MALETARHGAEAVIVIPFDRRPRLFPWGPTFVKEHAERNLPGARVELLDLTGDADLLQAIQWKRFTKLATVFERVRRQVPAGATADYFLPGPFYFEALDNATDYATGMWLFGNHALVHALCQIAGERDEAAVEAERQELIAAFDAVVHRRVAALVADDRPLLGLSGFSANLNTCLATAASLRRLYPRAGIVIGGAMLGPELARFLVRSDLGIDAVVIGFGEKPFASLLQRWRDEKTLVGAPLPYVLMREQGELPGSDALHPYRFEAAQGPFADEDYRAAHVDGLGMLHILPIRGCRWGACTFCADVMVLKNYRAPVIAPSHSKVAADIAEAVRHWVTLGVTEPRVFVDAAEVFTDEAVSILSLIDRELQALGHRFAVPVEVFFYIPARKIDLTTARAFRTFYREAWHAWEIGPVIAIESLNRAGLKKMKKGIDPLKAIAAVKTAIDADWAYVQAHYFLYYPGENRDAVEEEVALIRRSLHLLAHEKVKLKLNLPLVTPENELAQQPARNGLDVQKVVDPLLTARFGEPFVPGVTHWATRYRPDPSLPENDYVRPWFALFAAFFWYRSRLQMVADAPRPTRLMTAVRAGAAMVWKAVPVVRRALAGDRGMVERALLSWWCSRSGRRGYDRDGWHSQTRPILRIADGRLEKDFPFPFAERWSRPLADDELAVLRALYAPLSPAELAAQMNPTIGQTRLDEIVAEHTSLGVILAGGGRLLCLATDPEHAAAVAPQVDDAASPPLPPLVALRARAHTA